MTFDHWLNYATIILIMGFSSLIVYFLAGAKYSLHKALFRALFMWDFWYVKWFCKNKIYLWSFSLLILLICTELTLITKFSEDSIFQKPRFMFLVSPLLWASLFGTFSWLILYYNRTKNID